MRWHAGHDEQNTRLLLPRPAGNTVPRTTSRTTRRVRRNTVHSAAQCHVPQVAQLAVAAYRVTRSTQPVVAPSREGCDTWHPSRWLLRVVKVVTRGTHRGVAGEGRAGEPRPPPTTSSRPSFHGGPGCHYPCTFVHPVQHQGEWRSHGRASSSSSLQRPGNRSVTPLPRLPV
jgi:hypothetical protein